MMTVARIVRLAEQRENDRLLADLLRNGRPVPLAVRMRLSSVGGVEAAALGLALQRIVELTFIPDPHAFDIARTLADLQDEDGSFGTLASTATAVGGLGALMAQIDAMRWRRDGRDALTDHVRSAITQALGRAMKWLESQCVGGLAGDPIDSAIVVWQLGARTDDASRRLVAGLSEALFNAGAAHDRVLGPLLTRAAVETTRPAVAA